MEQLYYLLQQKAPFLLPFIVGVDYLQDDSTVTPLMIVFVHVGDKVLVVPVIGDNLYAIYDPTEDRYYPLSADWFDFLIQKTAVSFQATNEAVGTEDSPNLYNMIRPPQSGRTVYASVVDEPISKEYFEYGFVIVPKENATPTCRAYEVTIDNIETIQPGKTYLLRDFEGNLVPARLFVLYEKVNPTLSDEAKGKISPETYGILVTPKAVFPYVGLTPTDLPVGVVAPDQSVPYTPEEAGIELLVCDDFYCYLEGEIEDIQNFSIVTSTHVKKPLISSRRLVLPADRDYKVILYPRELRKGPCSFGSPNAYFVSTVEAFKNIGVTKIVKIDNLTYQLTGEDTPLTKTALAQKLVEKGLPPEDIYRLIKKADDQGEIAFVISEARNQFKNSLNDNTTPQARLQELLDAFDSQIRHYLSLYTKGYIGQETQRVVEDLYDALITYSGGGG